MSDIPIRELGCNTYNKMKCNKTSNVSKVQEITSSSIPQRSGGEDFPPLPNLESERLPFSLQMDWHIYHLAYQLKQENGIHQL